MKSLEAAFTFALHTVVGIALFLIVAAATWVLRHVVIALEQDGISRLILAVLTGVEYLLFAADVICLVLFVIVECVSFVRRLLRV